MIYGIKTVLQYLLGRDRAERNFAVFRDDTMIVSYPRSGNTWTRFLIANLLRPGEEISFANIERIIPDTSSISSRALKRIPRPRVIKSHEYFDHRYPRVIYIVRDPRDVVLSFYNFQRKNRQIPDAYPLEQYVADFVRGRLNSTSWGTWGENVASWVCTRGKRESFLFLHFEDLLEDTKREMLRVADFLKLSPDAQQLDRAITNSSAERMRQLEKKQQDKWASTHNHRKDIPFVGAAKAGGWQTLLPAPCVLQIESAWGDLMASLGYALVSPSISEQELKLASTLSR